MLGGYPDMYVELIQDLLAALCFGTLIGFERQWRQRFTGILTHALVALGAATFVTLPFLLDREDQVPRVATQVVTGIGFLGAGVIMRDGLSVRGLSTAATVWCTGAVGVLAGSGFPIAAMIATALIILCNLSLPPLARLIYRFAPLEVTNERYYMVEAIADAQQEAFVRAKLLRSLSDNGLALQSLESHALKTGGQVKVNAVVLSMNQQDSLLEDLVGQLALAPYVSAVSWSMSEELS
ncbi:MgtC/SapB family protein [Metapseudomonas resinovorans]|uniref:Protein MgtC n=1 Tax=Metapseudomonas resinovorans NBRC 106553 TaxID=1245471 RepID=S6AH89_METRE|nr:MgtC/SapB family protein [Pseudomonas resinovorans]BAN47590.1 MgtC family protein [Pseudomonas resinovorans NBRC 106553]